MKTLLFTLCAASLLLLTSNKIPYTTYDDDYFDSIIADAPNHGNIAYFGMGIFQLNIKHTIPDTISVVGISSNVTRFKLMSAVASIWFGDSTTVHDDNNAPRHGLNGGFTVNGNDVARVGLRLNHMVESEFHDIIISNTALDGLVLSEVQNTNLTEIHVGSCSRNGLVVENGCRTVSITNSIFSGSVSNNILIQITAESPNEFGLHCSKIYFNNTLTERGSSPYAILITDGIDIFFTNLNTSHSGAELYQQSGTKVARIRFIGAEIEAYDAYPCMLVHGGGRNKLITVSTQQVSMDNGTSAFKTDDYVLINKIGFIDNLCPALWIGLPGTTKTYSQIIK